MSISRPGSHQWGGGSIETPLLHETVLLSCHLSVPCLIFFTLGVSQECFSSWILGLLTNPIWITSNSVWNATCLVLYGSPAHISSQLSNFLSSLSQGYTAKPPQNSSSMTDSWSPNRTVNVPCCLYKMSLPSNTYNSEKDSHFKICSTACFWIHLKRCS